MKKKIAALFVVLFVITLFPFQHAEAERLGPVPETSFVFPASLQVIEEEVFSGTAAQTLVFQSGLLCILENAFSGAVNLMDVYIPASAEKIARSAFPINAALVIHGEEDSYSQKWAEENNVPFVVENNWSLGTNHGMRSGGRRSETAFVQYGLTFGEVRKSVCRTENRNRSMRPQDRPELNPIDYRFP